MSQEGRICPQCGYERQAKDDFVPDYECPRCGIIYAKYVPPQSESPAPTAEVEPEPQEEWVPAPLSLRAWAAIYTGGKGTFYTILLWVPLFYLFQFLGAITGNSSFSDPETWRTGVSLLALLVALYGYFYHPLRHDQTWGQKAFGIQVRPRNNPAGYPGPTPWLLRCVANIVAGFLFPVTLAVFLFGLATKKNLRGLADRFSSTVQYAQVGAAEPFRFALNRAFKPYVIAFLINVFLVGFPFALGRLYTEKLKAKRAAYVISPEARAKRESFHREMEMRLEERAEKAAATQHLIVLDRLIQIEQRHLADHGSYTENLMALVGEYADNPRYPANVLLMAAMAEGNIRAEQSNQTITIWVRTASGEWVYRVLRP